ncbi:MAG: hypothetical protein PUF72_03225 [Clostridiales bacterium]|nr:hypothetical protein [Clostridiales bacterium]
MKLSIWDIFKYIYKWKLLIVFSVAAAIVLSVFYTNRNQSYESQVVIKFNDACIKEGKTPKNEEFDPYEIISPDVITAVIEDLNMTRSVEGLKSRVKIKAIIPKTEETRQESVIKEGEEYTYHPDSYTVTYKGRVGESDAMVRDILDSIVKNYLNTYVHNYVDQISVNDFTFDEDFSNQDYIEIAEIMSNRIDTIISSLENYYSSDSSFRSSKTGMSFLDIETEYKHLRDFTIPKIYSNIYEGQISKDKDLLIKKYRQRIDEYKLQEKNFSEKAQMTKERLESFAQANVDVPNAYNAKTDDVDIIQDVYGKWEDENNRNVTTTYDDLIKKYVSDSTAANNARLNADECEKVISKFTAPIETDADKEELTEQIKSDIAYTMDKLNSIYDDLHETVEDFNNANATTHLSVLTGVRYYAMKSLSLYAVLFSGAAVMMSVFFALAYELIRRYLKEA